MEDEAAGSVSEGFGIVELVAFGDVVEQIELVGGIVAGAFGALDGEFVLVTTRCGPRLRSTWARSGRVASKAKYLRR